MDAITAIRSQLRDGHGFLDAMDPATHQESYSTPERRTFARQ
jgi:hypothetical protein